MKKIIVCDSGEWTRKLITLSRFQEICYFIDDHLAENRTASQDGPLGKIKSCGIEKKIFSTKKLLEENPEDILLIIGDSRKYSYYKKKLESIGLRENLHFFNGWKLTPEFYWRLFEDNTWEKIENTNENIFAEEMAYGYRAKHMASLIPDEVGSIMDLGCGNELLKRYLKKDVKYIGVDYKKRNDNTIICDLNRDPLPEIPVDMYYLAGVIYFIENAQKLIHQMREAKYVLLSYRGMERYLRLDGRFDGIYSGSTKNWIFTADLVSMFLDEGFTLTKYVNGYPMEERICDEDIFLFKR